MEPCLKCKLRGEKPVRDREREKLAEMTERGSQ